MIVSSNCCIFAHDDVIINRLIKDLRDNSFLLKDKGNIEDFLGVHVKRKVNSDGSIKILMTQTGLIDSVIEDIGLNTASTKHEKHDTPANKVIRS
jgi:hypothetical protein